MERQLASIQAIRSIEDISFKNKDGTTEVAQNIVKAGVLGWYCVTQRSNNFKVGDKVVYFEVDSVLPDWPVFEFLRDKGFRIKTIKLKGQYSQGLILPISLLMEAYPNVSFENLDIGTDLTKPLGVTKYEAPIPAHLRGLVKGEFPWFMSKTDETRIQKFPEVLERHKGKLFYVTEKVDGSSITVYYYPKGCGLPENDEYCADKPYIFGVCSRNCDLKFTEDNTFWKMAIKYDLEKKLAALNIPLALQGEVFGPGIEENRLRRKDVEVRWFNAINVLTRKPYNFKDAWNLFADLKLHPTPVVSLKWDENAESDWEFPLNHTVDELVALSIRKSCITPDALLEGLVFRPVIEDTDPDLGRLSFKAINPEYLVKHKE